jgi:hypothetical protein
VSERTFDETVAESAVTRGHRVVLEFDGGAFYAKLICPESGCNPASHCGRCAADLTDPTSKRCYDCEGMEPGECWLQGWFDDEPIEYFDGELEFPVTAEWDCDHPIIRVDAAQLTTAAEGGDRG